MFLSNIEIFFKHKFGQAPESVTHIGSYPEESPKYHIFEARVMENVSYFVIELSSNLLSCRELKLDEINKLKTHTTEELAPPI